MQSPLHLVFEDMKACESVRRHVEREVTKLERDFSRITAVRVVVKARSHRRRKGDLYSVRVQIELPGGRRVSANRNPPEDHAHEDAHVAIRDVFAAAHRQLQDEARRMRGAVKTGVAGSHGVIEALNPDKDHGFLRGDDGIQVYFHRNAVLGEGFDALRIGAEVHYTQEQGRDGPQASSLRAFGVSRRA
jgi:cold shock CspA family protein/ribosome-associated translation inhibitor RaiA